MSDLSEISILVDDLQAIYIALNAAYSMSMAHDLQEQYRQLSAKSRTSNITKALDAAASKVSVYLEEAAKEEDEPVSE